MDTKATVLIVPGLRDHVAEHWQTHLAAKLTKVRSVPPLTTDKLSCKGRIDKIQRVVNEIKGDIILVAHSAGCLMVPHWAASYKRPIKGCLLAAPPDLNASWPANYPTPDELRAQGWSPVPASPLPFPSILAASSNDYLAPLESARAMARQWGSRFVDLGEVGHLNPASGYGYWPQAEAFVAELDT